MDASTKKPLVYVNIGIVGTSIGTITKLQGEFSLSIPSDLENPIIRFSMIGYKSQEFRIEELLIEEVEIRMISVSTLLEAVTIRPNHFKRKTMGTISNAKNMVTGWGGLGKGGERGIKINIKRETYFEYLHFHIASTTYDSILLRLHIRSLVEDLPVEELLKEEILIPVYIKSGWVDVDLGDYNLVFDKTVALTLEWVDAWGKMDGNLHLSWTMFNGTLYGKEAVEDNWIVKKNGSPGIYLDVLIYK